MASPISHFKLVLLGDTAVGKSCLVVRFVRDEFFEFQEPTIGAAFLTQTVTLDSATVKFEIWDTAGQERFRTITSAYYRGADGIVMVYDVTSRETFDHVSDWLNEVDKYANEGTCKLLVGNKSDMDGKQVEPSEAQEYAETLQIPCIETSAKSAENVEAAFVKMASELIKTREAAGGKKGGKKAGGKAATVSLGGKKSGSGCC